MTTCVGQDLEDPKWGSRPAFGDQICLSSFLDQLTCGHNLDAGRAQSSTPPRNPWSGERRSYELLVHGTGRNSEPHQGSVEVSVVDSSSSESVGPTASDSCLVDMAASSVCLGPIWLPGR